MLFRSYTRHVSGTENMPGIVSFGLKMKEIAKNLAWVESLSPIRDSFVERLKKIPGAQIHGDPQYCLPTTVNFHLERVTGDVLMLNLDSEEIAVSSGSACASGGGAPSPVLAAGLRNAWFALSASRALE